MKFKVHTRRIARRPQSSRLADVWENAILLTCIVGGLAIVVTGIDRGAKIGTGTPAAIAAIEPDVYTPDPYDGLPAPGDAAAIERAHKAARDKAAADWAPRTVPRTTGGDSLYEVDWTERHARRDASHALRRLLKDGDHRADRHEGSR